MRCDDRLDFIGAFLEFGAGTDICKLESNIFLINFRKLNKEVLPSIVLGPERVSKINLTDFVVQSMPDKFVLKFSQLVEIKLLAALVLDLHILMLSVKNEIDSFFVAMIIHCEHAYEHHQIRQILNDSRHSFYIFDRSLPFLAPLALVSLIEHLTIVKKLRNENNKW